MTSLSSKPVTDVLGFWAEWEAPSQVRMMNKPSATGYPRYIHTPILPASKPTHQCKNTDPCVFGSHFLYSNCQQYTSNGTAATALQCLEPGDIVVFGSQMQGVYVLDTVFVVRDAIPFTRRNMHLANHVPPWYYTVTLDLLAGKHMLYIGADQSAPYEGMFSFSPCVQANTVTKGFSRPAVFRSLEMHKNAAVSYA